MTPGIRRSRHGCAWGAIGLLLTQLVSACATPSPPRVSLVTEFRLGADYQGAVQRVAFDTAGEAWLATTRALYRAKGGSLEAVDSVAQQSRRLALALAGTALAAAVAWRMSSKTAALPARYCCRSQNLSATSTNESSVEVADRQNAKLVNRSAQQE